MKQETAVVKLCLMELFYLAHFSISIPGEIATLLNQGYKPPGTTAMLWKKSGAIRILIVHAIVVATDHSVMEAALP